MHPLGAFSYVPSQDGGVLRVLHNFGAAPEPMRGACNPSPTA